MKELRWYPLRVTYGRELKLKQYLDNLQIRSFVPMQYTEIEMDGRRHRRLVPAIQNLIFVYSTRLQLDFIKELREGATPMRYIIDKSTGNPLVVPNVQMENFIAISSTNNEDLVYITEIHPELRNGERVRITKGIFSGAEGIVVRLKRSHRVMVELNGFVAVATAYIPSHCLQKIETV